MLTLNLCQKCPFFNSSISFDFVIFKLIDYKFFDLVTDSIQIFKGSGINDLIVRSKIYLTKIAEHFSIFPDTNRMSISSIFKNLDKESYALFYKYAIEYNPHQHNCIINFEYSRFLIIISFIIENYEDMKDFIDRNYLEYSVIDFLFDSEIADRSFNHKLNEKLKKECKNYFENYFFASIDNILLLKLHLSKTPQEYGFEELDTVFSEFITKITEFEYEDFIFEIIKFEFYSVINYNHINIIIETLKNLKKNEILQRFINYLPNDVLASIQNQ